MIYKGCLVERSPDIMHAKDHHAERSPEIMITKECPVDNVEENETGGKEPSEKKN